jgi:hypothetical protein
VLTKERAFYNPMTGGDEIKNEIPALPGKDFAVAVCASAGKKKRN